MNGVKFGDKHSYKDFGLILSAKTISPPKIQTNYITVPFRDGSIDLTEAVTDTPRYEDRQITIEFKVLDPINKWSAKLSEIENYLHGKKMRIIFDDDLAFYYFGRVSVNEWSSSKTIGTIVIEATVEPFKHDILSSRDDWEWDLFDFDMGVINETNNIKVDGEKTIKFLCRNNRVYPTIITDNPMTVIIKGKSFNLSAGDNRNYDLVLQEGENEMVFKGNGTVSIDYVGGSL